MAEFEIVNTIFYSTHPAAMYEKLTLQIVIQWDCERPKGDFETGDDKLQKDGGTVRELLAMHSQRGSSKMSQIWQIYLCRNNGMLG